MKLSIKRLPARLRAVFTKPALDADFQEELAYHLELQTEDYIKNGLSPTEAARQARIKLGCVEQVRDLHRETRGIPWLEQFFQDFHYAIRVLNRERGFTVVALLILAIGISLNTTVFSLVNTVLLRPVPFQNSDRFVWIANGSPGASGHDMSGVTSRIDTWEGLKATSRTLEQIEGYDPFSVRQTQRLTGTVEPETILSLNLTPGLLSMLGVKPILGRSFVAEDGLKNAPSRAVLSNQLWRRRCRADPHIVGQTIQINGEAVEIIGVLPAADAFTSVFFPTARVDLFFPLRSDVERDWGNVVSLIGRAKPGKSIDQVRADLNVAVSQLKQQYPDRYDFQASADWLRDWVSGSIKQPLLFLWIAAGFVLAIVSFNLGGLLLARGASRQKELAVRCALGAGRFRLVRQLLTECLTLVTMGAVVGGLIAWGFIHFLSARTGVKIPLLQSVQLDFASLGFTTLLCLVTVILCGIAPAWRLAQSEEIQNPLKDESRGSSGGLNQSRTRSLLVVLEVALACILAIAAGLMVRSFLNLLKVDLGFSPSNLIAVRIDPPRSADPTYIQQLLDRVRAMPGVEQAGFTDCIPVERDRSWGIYPVISDLPNNKRYVGAHVRLVSPGLFAAMGTPLLTGRDFAVTDGKGNPGVIIINQTLAKQFWPDADAVGREVSINDNFRATVIAVAKDVRHGGPEIPSGNEMYFSLSQVEDASSWDLLVRTRLPVATLRADLQSALKDVDPTLPLTKIRTMKSLVDLTLSSRRLLVWLIGGFAGIALGLAALGLYGLISYMVTQQSREIGIRMALGASAAKVQQQIVVKTMALAIGGLGLGLVIAVTASRAMASLLFGVSTRDFTTYLFIAVGLLFCAFVAGYLPARRASRFDPLVALRAE